MQKTAITVTVTTLVLGVFGAFFRWLQTTGAFEAEHGRAFLATASTFVDKQGVRHSNVLPHFSQGDVITTPRTQAPYMVTEYGVAKLPGLTTWQRAEAIIGIAHPDFREELIRAAERQKIWRRSNQR